MIDSSSPASFFSPGQHVEVPSEQQLQPPLLPTTTPTTSSPPSTTPKGILERLSDSVDRNLWWVRTVSIWGPILAGLIIIPRVVGFRRYQAAKDIPQKFFDSSWKLRGVVVHINPVVGNEPAALKFYHTPLLRDMFWFNFRRKGHYFCDVRLIALHCILWNGDEELELDWSWSWSWSWKRLKMVYHHITTSSH